MEFAFTLTGTMPILLHADDVMAADELTDWRKDPKNKSVSVAGDDRSPPWTWQTYLYHDGTHLAIPQENIMTALRVAGAKIPAKGKSTFKAMSQTGLLITTDFCRFTNHGEQIAVADIQALRDLKFSEQVRGARELGFDLLVKRAKLDRSKNVRVRAKFDDWKVEGTVAVSEPAITQDILVQLFEIAGRYAGLCDWRPSSPKSPGPYGMFASDVRLIKGARRAG
jgi:hypothetical protein